MLNFEVRTNLEGANLPGSQRHDDDVDDFMANLFGGQTAPAQPQQVIHKPAPHRQQQTVRNRPIPKQSPRRSWKLKRSVFYTLLILLILTSVSVPLYLFRDNISTTVSDLLAPPSPFKQELVENAGFTLYYPTKLPGTFKMETNNISSVDDVVLFVITDDEGKRINITLQKKPSGLNLEPLDEIFTDKNALDTKFGKLMIGTSQENMEVVNIVKDETWIIISCSKGTLSDQQFTEIIDSLKFVEDSEKTDA
jgi:hypothetical protein